MERTLRDAGELEGAASFSLGPKERASAKEEPVKLITEMLRAPRRERSRLHGQMGSLELDRMSANACVAGIGLLPLEKTAAKEPGSGQEALEDTVLRLLLGETQSLQL